MGASTLIVGTPGTSITGQCTGPTAGTKGQAADVNGALTSIENDLATISSGTWTCAANLSFAGGSVQFNAPVAVESGQTLTCASGSFMSWQGRAKFRPRVVLGDSAHTIDVTMGDTFVLTPLPSVQRLITLSASTGAPQIGERIRLVCPALQWQSGVAIPYEVNRTGSPTGLLAQLQASQTNVPSLPVSAEFEFGEGLVYAVTGTASNGGAIKLTLTAPAGALGNVTAALATGDHVVVASVGGTTEADGTWAITVNDATHITLTGTTYVHAWTSGGTVQITPGIWRLGMSSGSSYDGANTIGVIPGESA